MAKTDLRLTGGEYALVADRITLFYERYPDGRIITELVSRSAAEVTFRALVYRSPAEREPAATGWASEREGDGDVNTVACLENTETSAIGRALANLGFTAAAQRPSAEEMAKASRARARVAARVAERPSAAASSSPGGYAPTAFDASGSPASPTAVLPIAAAADAHLRADVRLLLGQAERAGLRAARAAAVRRVVDGAAAPGRLEAAERWLRDWLARRAGAAPAPDAGAPTSDAAPGA